MPGAYRELVYWWYSHPITFGLTGGLYNDSGLLSLGGQSSIYPVRDTTLGYEKFSGIEYTQDDFKNSFLGGIPIDVSTNGGAIYRGFVLHNIWPLSRATRATNISVSVVISSSSPTDEVYFGTDTQGLLECEIAAPFDNMPISCEMNSISSQTTEPSGVTYWYGYGETMTVEVMEPNEALGVWFKQSVSAGAIPYSMESIAVSISCDLLTVV